MASSSTAALRPSAPPLIEKPVMNWTELSTPLETTTNKVSRNFGKCLIVLGVCSGVGRQLAASRMTASPDTIIRTCYNLQIVMIVSLVTGALLWFFNRLTADPSLLIKQRREVGDQIEKTPLVTLRSKYVSSFVLSDSELNQWIRYLAQSAPFNDFMTTHSERIFTLNLEDETKTILKDRYLAFVDTTQVTFQKLIATKSFQQLFSDAELKSLQSFVANREAASAGVCNAESYRTFIRAQGVEILPHLKTENLQALVQGFSADVLESGVGIVGLKKDRAVELKAFGTDTETALFQQVANREGLQPYETFRTRNGGEAVGYITTPAIKELLFGSFSVFVIARDHGLVETRDKFGAAIARFGESAAEKIYTRILNNEIDDLARAKRTYLDFRLRNGIGVIEFNTFNAELIQLFRACFLKLPAANLIHPAYAFDRNLFKITNEEVRAELWGRWNGMTIAAILQTDRDGFVAAVTGANHCFDRRDWTPKAVQEIALPMSIKDIVSTYRVLFTMGVLTANDGNISDRLSWEVTGITEWTALIDTYGAFVFEQKLLTSERVELHVNNFIRTHAESYLNECFDTAMLKYVEVIQKFCMNPILAQKINGAKDAIAAEKQRYADWLRGHEADFERRIQARKQSADREVAQFESDHRITQKESEKTTAHREWSERKAAYVALQQGMKACEEEIQRDRETYDQKSSALGELRGTQTTSPANAQLNRMQAETADREAQQNLKKAEAIMQSHPFKARLEKLQKEDREIIETLRKIEGAQREHDMLSEEVNNLAFAQRKKALEEMIANPNKPVTGLKAAEEAKKAVKEAPKLLEEMRTKEERLAELASGLSRPSANKARLTLNQSAKAQVESSIAQVEIRVQLPRLRAEARQASEVASQWKAAEQTTRSLPEQIASLSQEIDQLRRQIDQKTGVLREKHDRCEESRRLCLAAQVRKQSTEQTYTISAQKLARSTSIVLQDCKEDVERLGREKTQALSQAQSIHAQNLQAIVQNFR